MPSYGLTENEGGTKQSCRLQIDDEKKWPTCQNTCSMTKLRQPSFYLFKRDTKKTNADVREIIFGQTPDKNHQIKTSESQKQRDIGEYETDSYNDCTWIDNEKMTAFPTYIRTTFPIKTNTTKI